MHSLNTYKQLHDDTADIQYKVYNVQFRLCKFRICYRNINRIYLHILYCITKNNNKVSEEKNFFFHFNN